MSAFLAVFIDTLRQTWRLRLPVYFLFVFCALIAALPVLLSTDGTSEGRLKIFLLYSGYVQIFSLGSLAVIWTAWLERDEREKGLLSMVFCRPIGRLRYILFRWVSQWLVALFFLACLSLCTFFMFQWLNDQNSSNEVLELRKEVALVISSQLKLKSLPVKRVKEKAYSLKSGDRLSFKLPQLSDCGEIKLSGKFANIGSSHDAKLLVRIYHHKNRIFEEKFSISGKEVFKLNLPSRIPASALLEMELQSDGDSPFYYLESQPFKISYRAGPYLTNLLKAFCMLSFLAFILTGLSLFFSQMVSTSTTWLSTFILVVIGFFKEEIRVLIIPEAYLGFSSTDSIVLRTLLKVIWEPLLFILPDMSFLNPTSRWVDGALISWMDLTQAFSSILPLCFLILTVLYFYLPRQELGDLKS